MFIYLITNTINGRQYIGQTIHSVKIRWQQHCCDSIKKNFVLYRAIRKYGKDTFEIKTLIKIDSKEWLDYYEKACIKTYNTKAPTGYNLTDGGEGTSGIYRSEETRQRMSNSLKGRKSWNKGLKSSPETIEKLRLSHKGHPTSEETKRKMSVSRKGRKHTEETKLKLRNIRLGLKASEETKKKLRGSHLGLPGTHNKPHTEEAKLKMRLTQLGRKQSPETIEKRRQTRLSNRIRRVLYESANCNQCLS